DLRKNTTRKIAAINKEVADKEKAKEKERLDRIKVNQSIEASGKRQLTDALISQGSRGLQALTSNEKDAQRIALAASIIQGFLAVQRALANPPGPPVTILSSIATGILAAGNTAVIAAQAFQTGGFPPGANTLIKVNERGQEAVLNAGAVRDIGVGNINAMNSGQGLNKTIVNEITYAPTINVEGEAPRDLIDILREDKEAFAKFFKEDIEERGFFE
ncbi:MAG: hypothetical protein IID03_12895, partial [Candidatus Dadabacteria bacterium]|nr:hypothetical protein [Candidatus Dadabacteria bacterium]